MDANGTLGHMVPNTDSFVLKRITIESMQPSLQAGEFGMEEKVDGFPLKCIFIFHLGHILFCLPN